MKIKFVFFSSRFLLLSACNKNNHKPTALKEFTFMGFAYMYKYVEVVKERPNAQEFVYFADPASTKVIKYVVLKANY